MTLNQIFVKFLKTHKLHKTFLTILKENEGKTWHGRTLDDNLVIIDTPAQIDELARQLGSYKNILNTFGWIANGKKLKGRYRSWGAIHYRWVKMYEDLDLKRLEKNYD